MAPLTIRLAPEYGNVYLTSRPADARLEVDGKDMGSATRRLRLTTVAHKLEISRPGYVTKTVTVTPRTGVAKRLTVRLEREKPALVKANPDNKKTAGGHVLRRVLLDKPVRFKLGASRREAGRRSNETLYDVELTRSFYIAATEVTNAQFQAFRRAHDSGRASGVPLGAPDQPVVSVSWDDAARYLNWLSVKDGLPPAFREEAGRMVPIRPIPHGYRMPTEAEWVYMARYEGGRRAGDKPLKYGWGSSLPPPKGSGNFADRSASARLPVTIQGYTDGYAAAAPVGKFPANRAGIHDLSGNAAEWCYDYYDTYMGIGSRVRRDPTGPAKGRHHVVRGSSWRHGSITELRLSYRDYANQPRDDLGFRIARYADEPAR
jgi:formylglycine-generating enzyme required for sulfatase activity